MTQQPTTESSEEQLLLRSLSMAIPLALEGDPAKRKVSTIELRLPPLKKKPVEGRIVLDESELSFNEFGDAAVVRKRGGMPLAIQVTPITTEEPDKLGRELYRIQLSDSRFSPDLHLVYSPDPLSPCRLLINTVEKTTSGREQNLLQVLPLFGVAPLSRDEEEELHPRLVLATSHISNVQAAESSFPWGNYEIYGQLGGDIQLVHDRNRVGFNRLGDATSTTLLGYGSTPFKLKQLSIDDPAKQNRTVWELVTDEARPLDAGKEEPAKIIPSYRLVKSHFAGGPHRLLVYHNRSLRYALPLNNKPWLRFQFKRHDLATVPDRERQAIEKIRQFVGDTFRFEVKASHVTEIEFSGSSATAETIALLPELDNLKRLRLTGCRDLREGDLAPLERLKSLELLAFHRTPVSDTTLQYVGELENVTFLWLYDEPTSNESEISALQTSDNGLAKLTELSKLQSITLYGSRITDAGLGHVFALNGLRTAQLHQTSATAPGLLSLTAKHPDLKIDSEMYEYDPAKKRVILEGATIVDSSFEALSKLPVVRHLHCRMVDHISVANMGRVAALGLESLWLDHCDVEDATIAPLKDAKGLKSLNLWNCRSVSDAGLSQLHGLDLERLELTGTGVTAEGLQQLQRVFPNCEIKKQH